MLGEKTHKKGIQLDSLGSEPGRRNICRTRSNSIAQPAMLAVSRCEEFRAHLEVTNKQA